MPKYDGACLCGETSYTTEEKPAEPHLCSCSMCQKSSGAPTVAWVRFPLEGFVWTGLQPNLYRSSEKVQRCSCKKCGGLLGALNEGDPNIYITICTLNNPNLIVPIDGQHSFKESRPSWWDIRIISKEKEPEKKLDHEASSIKVGSPKLALYSAAAAAISPKAAPGSLNPAESGFSIFSSASSASPKKDDSSDVSSHVQVAQDPEGERESSDKFKRIKTASHEQHQEGFSL